MPHFANYLWNTPCGLVAKFAAVYGKYNSSATAIPGQTTGATPVIGTQYVVPRSGFVRVSLSAYQVTVDSAVGSTMRFQISATDVLNNSRTIAPVTGFTAMDSGVYGSETSPFNMSALLYCKAGTTLQTEWNFGVACNGDGIMNYFIAYEMDR